MIAVWVPSCAMLLFGIRLHEKPPPYCCHHFWLFLHLALICILLLFDSRQWLGPIYLLLFICSFNVFICSEPNKGFLCPNTTPRHFLWWKSISVIVNSWHCQDWFLFTFEHVKRVSTGRPRDLSVSLGRIFFIEVRLQLWGHVPN